MCGWEVRRKSQDWSPTSFLWMTSWIVRLFTWRENLGRSEGEVKEVSSRKAELRGSTECSSGVVQCVSALWFWSTEETSGWEIQSTLSVAAADTDLGEFPQNADPAEKVKAKDGSLGNIMEGPRHRTETEPLQGQGRSRVCTACEARMGDCLKMRTGEMQRGQGKCKKKYQKRRKEEAGDSSWGEGARPEGSWKRKED